MTICIISSDSEICTFFSKIKIPFTVRIFPTIPDFLKEHFLTPILLFFDFTFIMMHDFSILSEVINCFSCMKTIIISRENFTGFVVRAIKSGCADYLIFPCTEELINNRIQKYLPILRSSYEKTMHSSLQGFEKIIGNSLPMRQLKSNLQKFAKSDCPLLFLGESGTGKTFAARFLHENSPRKEHAFYSVNAAAISEGLAESELFGSEPGAYTGAIKRKGFFEESDKGTLFLDEIAEISLPLQAKLLQVVENGTFYRLGSTNQVQINVRSLFATNADLRKKIKLGLFREDLFYRIAVVPIFFPRLLDRIDDIPALVNFFLEKSHKNISDLALEKLMNHTWAGNVRELQNCIVRAMVKADKDIILPDDIIFY